MLKYFTYLYSHLTCYKILVQMVLINKASKENSFLYDCPKCAILFNIHSFPVIFTTSRHKKAYNLGVIYHRAVPIPGICISIGPIPVFFDGIGIGQVGYTSTYQFCCLCINNHELIFFKVVKLKYQRQN